MAGLIPLPSIPQPLPVTVDDTVPTDSAGLLRRLSGVVGAGASGFGHGVMKGLEYVERPYHAIMGGLIGGMDASSPQGPTERFVANLTGQQQDGAYQALVALGAPPEATATRIGGLIGDIVNPLDPAAWLSAGASKAGRLAKVAGEAPTVTRTFSRLLQPGVATVAERTVPDIAKMAEQGTWSALNFAGKPILPAAVNKPIASALQSLGGKTVESRPWQLMRMALGPQEPKMDQYYPGMSTYLRRIGYDKVLSQEEVANTLNDISTKFNLNENDLRFIGANLEDPAMRAELTANLAKGQKGVVRDIPVPVTQASVKSLGSAMKSLLEKGDSAPLYNEAARTQLKGMGDLLSGTPGAEDYQPILAKVDQYLADGGDLFNQSGLKKATKGLDQKKVADVWDMAHWGSRAGMPIDQPEAMAAVKKLQAMSMAKIMEGADGEAKYARTAIGEDIAAHNDRLTQLSAAVDPNGPPDVVGDFDRLKTIQARDNLQSYTDDLRPEAVKAYRTHLMDKARPARVVSNFLTEQGQVMGHITEADLAKTAEAYTKIKKVRDDIVGMYNVADNKGPIADYLAHFIPGDEQRLTPKTGAAIARLATAESLPLREALMEEARTLLPNATDELRAQHVNQFLEYSAKDASRPSDMGFFAAGSGVNPNITEARMFKFPIYLINQADLGVKFEDDLSKLLNHQHMQASNWRYGYDAYDYAKENFSKYVKPGDTVPAGYVKMWKSGASEAGPGYFVPWAPKNPFQDHYMPADLESFLQARLKGAGILSLDGGTKAVMNLIQYPTRLWKAWTLGPFPGFHARNMVGNISLAHLGGLNPITEAHSYAASADAMVRATSVDMIKGMNSGALDNLVAKFAQAEPGMTADKLTELMKENQIFGGATRDMDSNTIANLLMKDSQGKRSGTQTWKDFATLDPSQNPILQFGAKVGSINEGFGRGALFLNRLEKNVDAGVSWARSVDDARKTTNKYLFDYGDQANFEREFLNKAFVPFWTFMSRNIPLQFEKLVTDPGKFAYLNRAYQGAASQYNKDFQWDDVPEWVQQNMGMPFRRTRDENGKWSYHIWSGDNWFPFSDVVNTVQLFKSSESLRQFVSRVNPAAKEVLQWATQMDMYTGRPLDERNQEFLGLLGVHTGVPPEVVSALKNIRVFSELDRLNPGGVFTKLGNEMGWWKGQRPGHTSEAAGWERFTGSMTGLKAFAYTPTEEIRKELIQNQRDISKQRAELSYALRKGFTGKAASVREAIDALVQKQSQLAQRQSQVASQ